MKRILALIMAALMLLSLVACNAKEETEKKTDDNTLVDVEAPEASAPVEDETPAEEAAPEEAPEETPEAKPEDKPSETPSVKPEAKPTAKPETAPSVKPSEPEAPKTEVKEEPKKEEKPSNVPTASTMGDTMLAVFRANRDRSLEDIANACISHESIQFFGMTMPVEEPFFAEFDGDLTGFDKCVKFGPAMGSIAFSGMIFEVSGDANAFAAELKSRANPRWNICVEAEQTICEVYGNRVFFLMCPRSLGE